MKEPGLFDLSYHEYDEQDYASYSRLKMMRDNCPALVRYMIDHPPPATPALIFGRAAHAAVLEPESFERKFLRAVEGDGRTKAVREAMEELRASNPGATILSASDYDRVAAMRDAMARHPKARRLLEGNAEKSLIWDDPETGVRCKGRIDLLSDRAPAIVDYKTTEDASPDVFEKSIYKYRYYLQGALYLQGAQEAGFPRQHFVIVAQMKRAPYLVACYRVDDVALSYGADEARALLFKWARCAESGEWPGFDDRVLPIGLPRYGEREISEYLEMEE